VIFTGCYYADENKNYHEMEPDTKVEAGQYVHTCERKTNGEIGYFSKSTVVSVNKLVNTIFFQHMGAVKIIKFIKKANNFRQII
jgi:hypothetical protein